MRKAAGCLSGFVFVLGMASGCSSLDRQDTGRYILEYDGGTLMKYSRDPLVAELGGGRIEVIDNRIIVTSWDLEGGERLDFGAVNAGQTIRFVGGVVAVDGEKREGTPIATE